MKNVMLSLSILAAAVCGGYFISFTFFMQERYRHMGLEEFWFHAFAALISFFSIFVFFAFYLSEKWKQRYLDLVDKISKPATLVP